MKTARRITTAACSIACTLWFALATHEKWWLAIVLGLVAFGLFYWVTSKVAKIWLWIPAMIVAILAVRFVVLPVMAFLLLIFFGAIGAAFAAIGWGFKTLGLIGGLIFALIVIIFLKNLFS